MTEVDLHLLHRRLGEEIAVSDWVEITQARIDQFAAATEDRQWIHVDCTRAAIESPSGTTVAHGFLTLALVGGMVRSALNWQPRMMINYGLNRVRFIAPVPAGSRLRGRFVPMAVAERQGALQVTWTITIEREGEEHPCCLAEWIVWYYTS